MIIDFNSSTWTDTWFQKLSVEEKLLFIYLWTNAHKNLTGLYKLGDKTMVNETGISQDLLEEALQFLSPKVEYDSQNDIVWVVKHIKHQFMKRGLISPTIVKKMVKDLNEIGFHEYVNELFRIYPILNEYIDKDSDGVYTYSMGEGKGTGSCKGGGEGEDAYKGKGAGGYAFNNMGYQRKRFNPENESF